jgi:hypothetical protein
LTEITDDAAASGGIVEDIAALARKLAENEPFKLVSGPEALLALASGLDRMITTTRRRQSASVVTQEERSMTAAQHISAARSGQLTPLDQLAAIPEDEISVSKRKSRQTRRACRLDEGTSCLHSGSRRRRPRC